LAGLLEETEQNRHSQRGRRKRHDHAGNDKRLRHWITTKAGRCTASGDRSEKQKSSTA
jgi:hypothetical protein